MRQLLVALAVLLVIVIPMGLQAYYYLPIAPETAVSPVLRQRLRYATVRIKMAAPARGRDGALIRLTDGVLHDTSAGLGTLVVEDGATWIITHAHWATPFDTLSTVTFSDWNNRELLTLSRQEFLQSVRYRDDGTLVLLAPWPLATKAAVRINRDPLTVRTRLHIVYQDPATRTLDVIPMALEAERAFSGLPVWRLRSLERRSLAPGNSGGGVFLNGRLAGNIWLSSQWEVNLPRSDRPEARRLNTFFSTAAPLPYEQLVSRSR